MREETSESLTRAESGLTARAILALILVLFIVQPVSMYYNLVMGIGLAFTPWIIILLWDNICKYLGKPLKPQEIFIMQVLQGAGSTGFFLSIIADHIYFKVNTYSRLLGISHVIPWWYSPPLASPVALGFVRSFFHPSLAVIITVALLNSIFLFLVHLSTGLFCFYLHASIEKLEYPTQTALASGYVAFTEKGSEPNRTFTLMALISAIYALVIHGLPLIIAGTEAPRVSIIPWGYADLTPYIDQILPGASLAFSTEFITLILGLVIPFKTALCMFIAAFSLYFIGNHLAVMNDSWSSSANIGPYVPRASAYYSWMWSNFNVWVHVIIGLAIACSIVPLIRHPQPFIEAFKRLRRLTEAERLEGLLPLRVVLLLFLTGGLGTTLLTYLLVPDYPYLWFVAFLALGWSFFGALVSSNVAGRTSSFFGVPWLRTTIDIIGQDRFLGGYDKWDIFFVPTFAGAMESTTGGANIAASLKMAVVTRTRIDTFIKALIIAMILGYLSSFIFVSAFWYISPIPSEFFPSTAYIWPQSSIWRATILNYIKDGKFFKFDYTIIGFVVGTAIYLITDGLGHSFIFPSLLGGCLATGGTLTLLVTELAPVVPPIALTPSILVGSSISNFFIIKRKGRDWFNGNRGAIVAGAACGNGVVSALASGYLLLLKARWVLPY